MTLAWLTTNISEDNWNAHYADAFKFDARTQARMEAAKPDLKPATGDKRSTIVFPKPDKRVKYVPGAANGVVKDS